MNLTLVSRMILFFLLIIIISVVDYTILRKVSVDTHNSELLIEHTFKVIYQREKLLNLLVDLEAGERGFVLTKNKKYLQPYNRALLLYKMSLEDLIQLTKKNQKEQKALKSIKNLIKEKINELNTTIYLAEQNKIYQALKSINSGVGKGLMDNIRNKLNYLKDEENRLLNLREKAYEKSVSYMNIAFLAVTLLLIFVSIFFGIFFHKHLVMPIVKLKDIMDKTKTSTKIPQEVAVLYNIKISEVADLVKAFVKMTTKINIYTNELNMTKEEAIKKSITDSLSGLFNREYMDMELKKLISFKKRTKDDISIIFADIDHFKKINDKFGHITGDKVIKEVAKILKKGTRDIDLAIRYGGEEFLIILPHTLEKEAITVAQKIRSQVLKLAIKELDGHSITISLGVTAMRDSDTMDTLIARADNALYCAKANGRNQVVRK